MVRPGTILAFLAGLFLGGCASAPLVEPADTSRTTVILLPDEDGIVGTVSVSNPHGSHQIDQAFSYSTVQGQRSQPSRPQLMGEERVKAAFGDLLKSQPPKPKSFVLYFLLDKAALTEESKALLPAIFAAVRERAPTEISIFGHADAIGSEKRNALLSADRAKVVADLLRKRDPSLDRIQVKFFGDKEPLVPSAPHVPEPRNRRVEIMIL